MKQYKLINNIFGWLAFVIAATTYCLTVEPTASFWDCPEFITTASKLEVGHPPGAPFFMLTGNFFTLFTSNPEHIAVCINVMSALLSAFCILFLFWTITHLARKLLCKDGIVTDTWQTVLIMGAGLTGALAYTWSDTFWFSAVEGEVYGYSSMFTALVFWLILKWEDHADEPHSDRWLVLIFYLTGLSIGVHLLNLLCLPAIALVYYFKKKPNANTSGSLCALGISMLLVVAVLYGVVPGIVKVGGWFELFFVNVMGMSFNTGLVIYILLLIAIVLAAIWSTTKNRRALIVVLYTLSVLLLGIPFFMGRSTMAIVIGLMLTCGLPVLLTMRHKGQYVLRKRFLNTSLLCMLMLMIGYSSYAVIVIRSTQNTPMDQNSPEDIFSLGTYLSREQYGDTPLFYGPAFSSTPCYEPVFNEETGETMYMYMVKKSEAVVRHEKQDPNEPDRYDHMETNDGLEYPGAMKMLFPRMHSGGHASHYQQWMGDITMHDVDATWTTSAGEKMSGEGQMPSQWDNIRFFTSYQVNFMYWRYFMWNFAGRQNDIQGHGNPDNGNWITGFSFIDNWLYGDQSKLPNDLKDNKGHNAFYCLPLLLGLLGLFWQAFKGQRGIQQFWVVFFLFFMTGLAIVMYLNQTPSQPRERDYAYAGSFYAFAIWIGLGAMALGDWLNKLVKNKPLPVSVGVSALSLLVPIQMVSQTWDDHDRSGRYACRDFGLNYLNTLPEDNMPIIFTNGDNDTFPLWYAQEVEGKRTDARVCNLSYLQTDWYTDQMKRQAYESAPLPIAWSRYEYVDNRGKGFDYFEVKPEMRSELDAIKQRTGVNTYDLKYIIDHYVRGRIAKGQPGVIPTDSVMVPVNKQAVIAQGTTLLGGKDSIPDYITIHFGNSVTKSQMMVYEMVARNDWKRPIYMSVTLGGDLTNSNYAGLGDYLVLEGLAYRLTPFRHARTADGRPNLVIDSEKMYDNMMNRFKYGNVAAKNIYLDETVMRMCSTHRNMFILLVKQLLNEGKTDKARKALEKCKQVLPPENIPYDDYDTDVVTAWLGVGNTKEASRVALAIFGAAHDYLNWGNTLSDERQAHLMEKFRGKLSVLYRILEIQDKFDKDTRAKIAHLAAQSEALNLVQIIYNNLEQNYNQPSSLPTIDLGGDGDGLGDF
ncbi:MAG: DUF2723 domain-containing protein [Bacteroidales bacterium]|nr:DUF2723 domain-containing protein [Bacteroidales bacterium]